MTSRTLTLPLNSTRLRQMAFTALALAGLICSQTGSAWAERADITTHTITGKSVAAGLLSLIIWPGIGQAVNSNPGPKVATHAVIGLFPPYRFWSGYDALVRRDGGYWHGRI